VQSQQVGSHAKIVTKNEQIDNQKPANLQNPKIHQITEKQKVKVLLCRSWMWPSKYSKWYHYKEGHKEWEWHWSKAPPSPFTPLQQEKDKTQELQNGRETSNLVSENNYMTSTETCTVRKYTAAITDSPQHTHTYNTSTRDIKKHFAGPEGLFQFNEVHSTPVHVYTESK